MTCQPAVKLFLSTLSLRRATSTPTTVLTLICISIHALLAESDPMPYPSRGRNRNFYPRSPCGERPTWQRGSRITYVISIHALLAESDARRASRQQPAGISIHALLAESDCNAHGNTSFIQSFLSTLSLRRATRQAAPRFPMTRFLSTLSLRRATVPCWALYSSSRYFYPRSPCGERPTFQKLMAALLQFLSTLSLRRATGI